MPTAGKNNIRLFLYVLSINFQDFHFSTKKFDKYFFLSIITIHYLFYIYILYIMKQKFSNMKKHIFNHKYKYNPSLLSPTKWYTPHVQQIEKIWLLTPDDHITQNLIIDILIQINKQPELIQRPNLNQKNISNDTVNK